MKLKGKNIVLGVTGGIAAYKAAELVRELVREEAKVHVMMTKNAQAFITPLTLQTLSGNAVITELFSLFAEAKVGHIALADMAEIVVIAPATANIIGKIAAGIADDMLTTVVMATKAPVLIAPAMNVHMWDNPICQQNVAKLRSLGYYFVGPAAGELACGYEGKGRLAEITDIIEEIKSLLAPKDFAGEKILVTAGPTAEPIDPVRFISNHSSGKMGFALARAALRRGAEVTLISGPTHLAAPKQSKFIAVRTAQEMRQAVLENFPDATFLLMAAAVSDYRPKEMVEQKIKKIAPQISLELEQNPDILEEVGRIKGTRVVVGFAAETEDLIKNAQKKLTQKNLDLIVANDLNMPGAGFAVDTNIVKILDRSGKVEELPLMTKEELADCILDRLKSLKKS
ncbi:MAG: bifunctional phosphopantothenoylcysteine decarboxylase/phosphopantothenate--cysteine ligase CoaBC [Thermodesulfobacteriota bacterium]